MATTTVFVPKDEFFRAKSRIITVRPTITLSAYVAEDCIGGLQTLTEIVNFNGRGGFIHSITVVDADAENAPLNFLFFSANPTASTTTDAAPFVIHADDVDKLIGIVAVAAVDYDLIDAGTSIVTKENLGIVFETVANSTSALNDGDDNLYMAVHTSGTPTYTAVDDLIFKIGIVQG